MSEVQDSALAALTKYLNEQLAAEGITPELLSNVMLELEYSPVLPFAGGQYGRDDVSVVPYGFMASDDDLPEQFMVVHPLVSNPVNRESLKIMRARWLLARGKAMQPAMDRLRASIRAYREGEST